MGKVLAVLEIERFHVMSLPSRLRRKTENSRHVGVQRDRSFYGDLHKMSDKLMGGGRRYELQIAIQPRVHREEITVHFSKKVRTLQLVLLAVGDLERCSNGNQVGVCKNSVNIVWILLLASWRSPGNGYFTNVSLRDVSIASFLVSQSWV